MDNRLRDLAERLDAGLIARREFLRILSRIRREYGASLSPEARRQLRREEWRCRRHYIGGVLGIS